jgi:hypothetical protein
MIYFYSEEGNDYPIREISAFTTFTLKHADYAAVPTRRS